jgi:hypothetical protein
MPDFQDNNPGFNDDKNPVTNKDKLLTAIFLLAGIVVFVLIYYFFAK